MRCDLRRRLPVALILLQLGAIAPQVWGQVTPRTPAWLPGDAGYERPYFPGAKYDPAIPTPAALLGFELGNRPALHGQIEHCLRAWDEASERLALEAYGKTHEGRGLSYAVVTSASNRARLADIRAALNRLADPRLLGEPGDVDGAAGQADRLVEQTPAVAWLAYSIHGDELSGADAALAVTYHLVAATDEATQRLTDELVILIDPLQNPDGRDRFIHQLNEVRGYTPVFDVAAWQTGGRWPWGRGNHYCFDLNRDWLPGTQPETIGRRAAVLAWHPHLFVDAHEMGPDATFLFTPPREPVNPHLPGSVRAWMRRFADDQAGVFDGLGWSYYSGDWLEHWYPGYGNAWAGYLGAVGMLYEQARTSGHPIVQNTGRVLTYREAVHRQVASTMANLETLRANRAEVLSDFVAQRRAALVADGPPGRVFLVVPGPNRSREREFLDNLAEQGIEIQVAQRRFKASEVTSALGPKLEELAFPPGTYVVPRRQPRGPLLAAVCEFDPHLSDAFVQEERRELERTGRSRLYEFSAWSLPLAYALEAYWSGTDVSVLSVPYKPGPPETPNFAPLEQTYGYAIDGADDRACAALAYLLQSDVRVRVGEKPFVADGRALPRGSYLIRAHENEAGLAEVVEGMAEATGIPAYPLSTARGDGDSPDLGGDSFPLLVRPRVALLGDRPVAPGSWGELYHLLDVRLGLATSLLDGGALADADLRPYNVLIIPGVYNDTPLRAATDKLREWLNAGGTLIALEGAAGSFAAEEPGLSSVRDRSAVLEQLHEFEAAGQREQAAGRTPFDPAAVWETPREPVTTLPAASRPVEELRALEEWRARFAPVGVIARGLVNPEHWLAFGCPEELPLFVAGGRVLVSKPPAATPVRFADAERLRLSGLLWPEAAARLAGSAYATVEPVGSGQIVLFAQNPDLRGYWAGTRRLLMNAILLGPGCGTNPPRPR